MDRRNLLKSLTITASSVPLLGLPKNLFQNQIHFKKESRIWSHSVCKWCYQSTPLEILIETAQEYGISSIELLGIEDIKVVQSKGLTCALANGSSLGITQGFNNPDLHEQLQQDYIQLIPQLTDLGIEQVICFSGNRGNISDLQGLENAAVGLEPVLKIAEKHNIIVTMELLNSKIDHADYMCDHTAWGAALVEKIGSSQFKLLYDIYHMQIMEGDVVRTIEKNQAYISHYHTGGVPGRNEIDETQELYYPRIMEAITKTNFKGYVAQEFIPTSNKPLESLKKAIEICS